MGMEVIVDKKICWLVYVVFRVVNCVAFLNESFENKFKTKLNKNRLVDIASKILF